MFNALVLFSSDRDMSKIGLDFGMKPAGIADLSCMLNDVKNVKENWSLNGMLLHLVSNYLYDCK